jgi:hypothetical protein
MLVLIDESGDPGFKLNKGSSSHFVAAMVIFNDFKEAEACSSSIDTLRQELGFKTEFKFNNSRSDTKDKFFAVVNQYKFEIFALVVDKKHIFSENLKRNDDKFYNYFVRQLLGSGAELKNARVKIDGSGDREFKNHLQKYLKNQLTDGMVDSVKFADSQKDNLVQLADMIAGAIARSYKKDRNDAQKWRKAISPKIRNCWEFK